MDGDEDEEEIESELEDMLEQLAADETAYEMGVPRARFRVTYREGRLLVIHWADVLAEQGPVLTLLEDSELEDLLIADLAESRDSEGRWELTMRLLTADGPSPPAERAILDWASDVGYRRIWLPDRVVNLSRRQGFNSRVKVHCHNCGQTWHDSGRAFWSHVVKQRSFPTFCRLCGADLPVWEPDSKVAKGVFGASDRR